MWNYRLYFIIGGILFLILTYFIVYKFLSRKNKLLARLFAYTILAEIIISPLRGYVSFMACMVVGFAIFILFTFYIFYKYGREISVWKLLLMFVIGISLINFERIFNFKQTLISLPDESFHLAGVFIGYSMYKIKGSLRWTMLLLSSAFCCYMYFVGYELWINKLNYGTFSGTVIERKFKKLVFVDTKGKSIQLTSQKKIVVLDFWYSRCGVCFHKFPIVQKVYNKYKNNPRVGVYAINSFIADFDKDGDAFRIIKEKGYSFPVLVSKNSSLLKELKIEAYPTVIILNQNDELVFRGDINLAEKKIEELLKDS